MEITLRFSTRLVTLSTQRSRKILYEQGPPRAYAYARSLFSPFRGLSRSPSLASLRGNTSLSRPRDTSANVSSACLNNQFPHRHFILANLHVHTAPQRSTALHSLPAKNTDRFCSQQKNKKQIDKIVNLKNKFRLFITDRCYDADFF